jgi:hypothetical protein
MQPNDVNDFPEPLPASYRRAAHTRGLALASRLDLRARSLPPCLAGALLLSLGCADGPPPTNGVRVPPRYVPTPIVPAPAAEPATPTRLRRLTNGEIENVVTDLLGARPVGLTASFLPDPRVGGYDNDALALGVSESKAEEILTAAERVAGLMTAPGALDGQAPCPDPQQPAACVRAFAERVTARAWGRPASADELTRLDQVFTAGSGDGGGYAGGVSLVAEAILASPHFVYRSELGGATTPVAPGGLVTLAATEVAAAISFTLGGSRPDPALLAAALAGELADRDGRERQARRLLAAPGGRQQMARFVRAWLGLEDVGMINKDLAFFPSFTPKLRQALDRELSTFLTHALGEGLARLDELFLADYTFPSPTLLAVYRGDLLTPPGDFHKVRLHERRRGLLSSPAFLAAHALISQTNPVERGLMVRGRLLCQEVPPPPPDVLAQPPGGAPGQTTRSKYEAHQREPRCASCHQLIDPIGFGFEQFDGMGQFRQREGTTIIDARGELVGTDIDAPFTGPAQLSEHLMRSAMFRRCFVNQLYQFVQGRTLVAADAREVDFLAGELERLDHHIDELMVAIIKRPVFVLRRQAEGTGGPP